MSLTAEQIEKSRAEFIEFKSRITTKADLDSGCIEFYLDEKLFTTWTYCDCGDDAVDEFLHIMYAGWLARQETLCVELPDHRYEHGAICVESVKKAIEAAGIAHK